MIYVYFSAPFKLPEKYITPEYLEAQSRDKHTYKIYENTSTKEITIGRKEPVKLNDETGKETRYSLMLKMIRELEDGCSVLFRDITQLSTESEEAAVLYGDFLDRHIRLEFKKEPWLNTSNMELLLKENPTAAKRAALNNVACTVQSRNEEKQVGITSMYQESEKVKKNGI